MGTTVDTIAECYTSGVIKLEVRYELSVGGLKRQWS